MKKATTFTVVKYILFLTAGVAIIYYLFNSYYTASFGDEFKSISIGGLVASTLCVVLAHIFRALRWRLMIIPLESKKPSFLNVFNALMIGYLANLALPRAGELARCAWLAKKEKFDTAKLIGSVIAERVFDLFVLLILVVASLFLYRDLLAELIDINHVALLVKQKLPLIAAGLILAVLIIGLFIFLSKNKHPFASTLNKLLKKLSDGLFAVKKIKSPFAFTLLTIAIWFFYIASSYFGFKILQQTALLTFTDALLLIVASSFGMIAPIQGGIGAFHYIVAKCLMLLGIAATPALVFATAIHASQTLMVILLGFIALIPYGKIGKKTIAK